jgi:hypothetical protein
MRGSVALHRSTSSTYWKMVASGSCQPKKSLVRSCTKRWGLSLNPCGKTIQISCSEGFVESLKTNRGWLSKCRLNVTLLDKRELYLIILYKFTFLTL